MVLFCPQAGRTTISCKSNSILPQKALILHFFLSKLLANFIWQHKKKNAECFKKTIMSIKERKQPAIIRKCRINSQNTFRRELLYSNIATCFLSNYSITTWLFTIDCLFSCNSINSFHYPYISHQGFL